MTPIKGSNLSPKQRIRYGMMMSIVSLIINVILSTSKIILGLLFNSVVVLADGFNNLSDVASNGASLLGFKYASKSPDKEHPFGHGRMEYIASLIITFLIFFLGIQTLWDAFLRTVNPEMPTFSPLVVVALTGSILAKILLGYLNIKVGKQINAMPLIAAGKDSYADVLASGITLVAVFLAPQTTLPIDGLFGMLIAVIILKTGYGIFKETVTALLGAPPDEKLLNELEDFVRAYPDVLGIHDLMIHDYGPKRRYMTLHVEVDKEKKVVDMHDLLDEIERDISKQWGIKATLHLDPVDLTDKRARELHQLIEAIVKDINPLYSTHDFRMRRAESKTAIYFDVLLPADDVTPYDVLRADINARIADIGASYEAVIDFDHKWR